jgi:hypothetical protein
VIPVPVQSRRGSLFADSRLEDVPFRPFAEGLAAVRLRKVLAKGPWG